MEESRPIENVENRPAPPDLPPGLERLVIRWSVSRTLVDLHAVADALGFVVPDAQLLERFGFTIVTRDDPSLPWAHAHVSVIPSSDDETETYDFVFDLYVKTGPAHDDLAGPGHQLTTSESITALAAIVPGPPEGEGLYATAYFSFKYQQFRPSLPLPFAPRELLGDMPESPVIAGVEVEFTAPESRTVHRANVTTFDAIGEFTVRLNANYDIAELNELLNVSLGGAAADVQRFVRPVGETRSGT